LRNAAGRRPGVWATRFALVQIVLLIATVAGAQGPQSERPYRGLFGYRDHDTKGRQPIDFTTSLTGGYDNSGNDQFGAESLTPFHRTGSYTNLDSALRIVRGRRSRRLTVSAGDALRYFSGSDSLLMTSYQGSLAFTSPLWPGAVLDVNQGVGYTSYYQLELFPTLSLGTDEAPKGPSSDYAVRSQPAYSYNSAIQLTQKFSSRSELRLEYDRRSVMFSGLATDLLTQGGGIKFTHRFVRNAGFHAGVASRSGQYGLSGGADPVRTYDLDFGLDYDRPLSRSRRTVVSFSSGSSLTPQGGKTYYRVTGDASLTHQMGRTWTAILRYGRALRFVEAFPQPLLSDSIIAALKGNPSRRVDFSLSGGYTAGVIGVSAGGGAFGTYTGTTQVGISLNRHFALFSEYLYYHYRFGEQALIAAFPGQLDRQTARVGLKLWVPILN